MKTEGTYRQTLLEKYEVRAVRNRNYSFRAYARDLGLSAASLSLILSGKQGVSAHSAQRIARKLSLSEEESARFVDLTLLEHARSRKERELARIRLRRHTPADSNLSLEAFRVISDWYHFAIMELTEVEGFQSSPKWIARALDISEAVAEMAIDRMKRLELLEEVDGKLKQTQAFLATPSGIPSDALKKFHTQLLERATQAIHLQSVEERDFSSIVLPVRSSDIGWAKEELKTFRRSLMERLEKAEKKDRVYCLSMQFFGLSESPARTRATEQNPQTTTVLEKSDENA